MGPWLDNNLATAEVGEWTLRLWWARGEVREGRDHLPDLVTVCDLELDLPPRP